MNSFFNRESLSKNEQSYHEYIGSGVGHISPPKPPEAKKMKLDTELEDPKSKDVFVDSQDSQEGYSTASEDLSPTQKDETVADSQKKDEPMSPDGSLEIDEVHSELKIASSPTPSPTPRETLPCMEIASISRLISRTPRRQFSESPTTSKESAENSSPGKIEERTPSPINDHRSTPQLEENGKEQREQVEQKTPPSTKDTRQLRSARKVKEYQEQLRSQVELFFINSLEFKPQLQGNQNSTADYLYCSIEGVAPLANPRVPPNSYSLTLLPQPWLMINMKGYANRSYQHQKLLMQSYLKEYKMGGYALFASLIEGMLGCSEELKMDALAKYFAEETKVLKSELEVVEKFARVVRIALTAETILPKRIHRLVGPVTSATFSQLQCAALVARMCFSNSSFFSFRRIFSSREPVCVEKIRFLMTYFDTVTLRKPDGNVSFRRVCRPPIKLDHFRSSTNRLDVRVRFGLAIEETSFCTQVDFANKHLGGGVLNTGSVQEEIRFLMCPEMIVGMLITDPMRDNEAISIVGAQVYSSYDGYSKSLKWSELRTEHSEQNFFERDAYLRHKTECIAIDATEYYGTKRSALCQQLDYKHLHRELTKAYVGFSAQGPAFAGVPVVSGWWGCGAFNGNKPLKAIIQAIAAGLSDRPLLLCPFEDTAMGQTTQQFFQRLTDCNVTTGELLTMLMCVTKPEIHTETHVYDSICQQLSARNPSAFLN